MTPDRPPTMASSPARKQVTHLRRRTWLLWVLTFGVLLALTASVPILYLPVIESLASSQVDTQTLEHAYYALVGLSGMVLVFCLYTALKQRDLDRTRDALQREEQETEGVRTRLSELSAMFQVSTTLNLQLRLDVILEIIVRRVVSALRAQQASIMIFNPESGDLETRATYGLESEFARNARKRLGEGIAGWVAQHGQAVLLNGNGGRPELTRHYKADRNITSALSLPLRVGERCVGVLNVNRINHPEPFQDHHREILFMFAEHVAAVIERAETLERLGSRSRELEEANLRLTQMNAMKDVFLSTASHELKTPLTSVIAYAEILDDNENRLDKKQRSEFLHRLRGEAGRLMDLIEDILDLTRLESGKLSLRTTRIAPNDVVRAAVETARTTAKKYGITVREEYESELPELMLDEIKMRQVVVNLLVNAVKFSNEKGVVTVATAREPKYVRIEVRDQGPGIKPEDATHIFELFGQGRRDGHRDESGVGIGLHLVKRISELHGGHVGVNSVPGQGSMFWVRLPIALGRTIEETQEQQEAA
jgi:signal transduction histidine kinase